MFPWKCCELYGALNLFGCCCQVNEVSEWGQPGGGRGQPRASAACQAAVLLCSRPGPAAALVRHSPLAWHGTQHTHLPHTNTHSLAKAYFTTVCVGHLSISQVCMLAHTVDLEDLTVAHTHILFPVPSRQHKTSLRADCPHQLPVKHWERMFQCMHQYEQFF